MRYRHLVAVTYPVRCDPKSAPEFGRQKPAPPTRNLVISLRFWKPKRKVVLDLTPQIPRPEDQGLLPRVLYGGKAKKCVSLGISLGSNR